MQSYYLKFFVQENHKHHSLPVYEWLLEHARKAGIKGGSAFRAIAGYGRHHKLHEAGFFELAGSESIEVGFAVTGDEADKLLNLVNTEKLSLFYVKTPVEFGLTSGTATD